ncbi:MAG: sirohydrochlorin chelatase [Fusobacteriaceae bacterium]
MSGILVVGHGSRSKEAQEGFDKIIGMLKDMCEGDQIVGAHMELCSPSIEEGVERLLLENPKISTIKVVPYFLYTGIHIKEDIPEIIEELKKKYAHIDFKFGKPLGAEIEIAKILKKRVNELC